MNELFSKPRDGSVSAEDRESQQSGLQQERHSRWRQATSAEGCALGTKSNSGHQEEQKQATQEPMILTQTLKLMSEGREEAETSCQGKKGNICSALNTKNAAEI